MEYQILFYGGLAGALITLVISIKVYMKLEISQVIADITGNRFKRKKKNNRISLEAQETKRTTSEIKLRKEEVPVAETVEETALMSQEIEPTSLFDENNRAPTAKKDWIEETSLLGEASFSSDETTLLANDDETSILLEGDGETAILIEAEEESDFQIEVDVMIVHTTKVIHFNRQKSLTS